MHYDQVAHTYALLSVFEFIRQFTLSDWDSPVARSIYDASMRKKKPTGKVSLARWFLSFYGESFGLYQTKMVLKYLAGRRAIARRSRETFGRQEVFDWNDRPKQRRRKPTKQLELFAAVNSRSGRIH